MKVREWVTKKCLYERKDGTTGMMYHKSVVLDNGTTIRWNRRGECWSITSAPRWNSAVATSLSRYAMTAADLKGSLQTDRETYHAFTNFQTRLVTLVDVETAVDIIMYLKG